MMNQCDVEKTTISDVYGLKVTSKIDDSKYIFLLAEGLIIDSGLEYVNDRVRYWSSTLNGNKRFAYYLSASLCKQLDDHPLLRNEPAWRISKIDLP